jgi:hypothetical protein
MLVDLLYQYPLWLIATAIVSLSVLVSLAGLAVVRRIFPLVVREAHNEFSGFVIAVVGAIYAVLLAFITVMVWEDHNDAGTVVATEAAVVGTLYDNASGLHDPMGTDLRGLIRAYAREVVENEWPAHAVGAPLRSATETLRQIRETLLGIEPVSERHKIYLARLIDGMNRLHEARQSRLGMADAGIGPTVWSILIAGSCCTLSLCLFFGIADPRIHGLMTAVLAASIAVVMVLIVAFDYPFRGSEQIAPDPFLRAMAEMAPVAPVAAVR